MFNSIKEQSNISLKSHTSSLRGRRKVFVAMSGGVDSSVAALLLKRAGYDVCGVYMKEWIPPGIECTAGDDRLMAARVAAHLGIPFTVWDFSEKYKQHVADYMLCEYGEGRTPNPDVMCNKEIKFGFFLKKALEAGADLIATGHYVRLWWKFPNKSRKSVIKNSMSARGRSASGGKIENWKLKIAKDLNKDQSYFLWTLSQDQLQHCLFPIGAYTKPEVREIARKAKLPSWDKKDSQGVCFVGTFDFAEFLRMQIPKREGAVVTSEGEEIGRHDGVQFYTYGQRHGVSSHTMEHGTWSTQNEDTKPLYVAEKDMNTNTLVVVKEDNPALYKTEISTGNIHWISGFTPELPLKCQARIRYRQPLQRATISKILNSKFQIHFDVPQRAVAPGQSIVFYQDEEMLGGGIIGTER